MGHHVTKVAVDLNRTTIHEIVDNVASLVTNGNVTPSSVQHNKNILTNDEQYSITQYINTIQTKRQFSSAPRRDRGRITSSVIIIA